MDFSKWRGKEYFNDIEKREISEALFGDAKYLGKGVDDGVLVRLLRQVEEHGKDVAVEGFKQKRKEHLEVKKAEEEEWKKLFKKFNGAVIGVDNCIDVFETGFSVRVLINSGLSFDERRKFVTENQRDFLVWLMEEIKGAKRMMKKIGDMRFYRPAEMVTLRRASEIEVKFEIKEDF